MQYQSVSVKGNPFNYFTNMVSNDHLLFELGSAKGHEWHLGHVHLHSELHLFGVDARDSKTKLSCTHSNDTEMLQTTQNFHIGSSHETGKTNMINMINLEIMKTRISVASKVPSYSSQDNGKEILDRQVSHGQNIYPYLSPQLKV